MKTTLRFAVLALVALGVCTLTCEKASAQFTASVKVSNGTGANVIVTTTVAGLPANARANRLVMISTASSVFPVMQSVSVNFSTNGVKVDTLPVTIPFPELMYASSIVTDTNGATVDTALSVLAVGLVTPPITKPSDTIGAISTTVLTANFSGLIDVGNDTTYYKVIVAYGNTTFTSPSWSFPQDSQVFYPVIGQVDQHRILNSQIVLPGANATFSFKIITWNKAGRDTSKIFSGTTQSAPSAGTCSTPMIMGVNKDTIKTKTSINPGGVACTFKTYIATCATCKAFDSLVTAIPAPTTSGPMYQNDIFVGIPKGANYWVWAYFASSINTYTSNRVLVNVPAAPDSLSIVIDSITTASQSTATVNFRVLVPANDSATNLTMLITQGTDSAHAFNGIPVGVARSGITKFALPVKDLIKGQTYTVTIYGNDVLYSRLYMPWQVQKKFVFNAKAATTVFEPAVSSPKISIYPNPGIGMIFVLNENWKQEIYSLFDMTGKKVFTKSASGARTILVLDTLAPGTYVLTTIHNGSQQFLVSQ